MKQPESVATEFRRGWRLLSTAFLGMGGGLSRIPYYGLSSFEGRGGYPMAMGLFSILSLPAGIPWTLAYLGNRVSRCGGVSLPIETGWLNTAVEPLSP